jgi:predicted ferric reductase
MSQLLPLALLASTVAAAQPGGNQQNAETEAYLAHLNKNLSENYAWSLLAFAACILIYRSAVRIYAHMRHLASLTATSQKYFAYGDVRVNWIKDHILYAPTFHHKRATEIQFHRFLNFGSIPTRFQSVFILAVIIVNVFACCWNIPWNDARLQVLPILRNRTGTLSVANLVPILVMATIKNPLIELLDISYDTFNMMHRWLGRLSILQGVAHTVCYLVAKVEKQGWEGVQKSVQSEFIYAGLAATIGFVILFFQAPKMVRSWAYEVFLHMHFIVVAVTFAFLWIHIKSFPHQLAYLIAAIAIWATTRAWRFGTLAYRTWGGRGRCQAVVEAMPGDALRVTLHTPRPWTYRSGQSLYLSIPSIGWWTSHPFSIAWSDAEHGLSRSTTVKRSNTVKLSEDPEKRPIVRARAKGEEMEKATYSLVIKARTGFTGKLYDRVVRGDGADAGRMTFDACIEGPYGGDRSMASYGTVMLFASGVGITHQIPYIKQLLEGYNDGTVAARRVTLVWAVTSTDCLEWIRPWMHEILGIENRRDVLKIMLYITRAGLSQPIRSPSETVRMLRGRPDVQSLMEAEADHKLGCLGVSVCAGGGLADDVRRSCRILLSRKVNVEFIEEGKSLPKCSIRCSFANCTRFRLVNKALRVVGFDFGVALAGSIQCRT